MAPENNKSIEHSDDDGDDHIFNNKDVSSMSNRSDVPDVKLITYDDRKYVMVDKTDSASKQSVKSNKKDTIIDMNSPSTGNIHAFVLNQDASIPQLYAHSLFGPE